MSACSTCDGAGVVYHLTERFFPPPRPGEQTLGSIVVPCPDCQHPPSDTASTSNQPLKKVYR